jgi:hypothetical protein
LRPALEPDSAFDVLGVQLRLGGGDSKEARENDGDHHPRKNAIGDHGNPFLVSDERPPMAE